MKNLIIIFFLLISTPILADSALIENAIKACNSGSKENFEKIIKPLVDKNNPNAQVVLAEQYLKTSYCGDTVQPNYKEAINLLKKAALQKHIWASIELSSLYNPKGTGKGRVRSDSLQSLKWALLASSFNNEFANIKPENSDDWNSEKYQNAFQIEKEFNTNKIYINSAVSQANKNLTKEQISLVNTHIKKCLQDLTACNDNIVARDKTEPTQIANSKNNQNLVCKIQNNKAIPCTEEKAKELDKKGTTKEKILQNPMLCGTKVSTEFINVIVNEDNSSITVNNISTKICSGAPIKGKEAIFRQQCEPIEEDYLTEDGFMQGKLIYNPSKKDQVAKWESEQKKQLIQNLDSSLAVKIIKAPSTIAYSFGECYPAEKKELLVKEHEELLKQKELDDIAEKKLEAIKNKYADAPSCNDLPNMEKYKKKAQKTFMDVAMGNPPEPCKKGGAPGTEPQILLPKSMLK